MRDITIPRKLLSGGTIAVISPSESLTKITNDNIQVGVRNLSEMGFHVVFSEHSTLSTGLATSAEARAADFMEMMTCNHVDAVMAAIGGYSSLEIVEFLDIERLSKSTKPFIGFSDVTVLNQLLLTNAKLMNFYGPSFAVFCQNDLPPYTKKSFLQALCTDYNQHVESSLRYADDLWYLNNDGKRCWKRNEGWKAYHQVPFSGRINGGNLETILALAGTKFMPDFSNCVLFLEEANAKPISAIIRELQQLKLMGALNQVRAIIFGRFWGWSQDYQKEFIKCLNNTILRNWELPILYNLDFGHSDPMLTIPLGGIAEYDGENLVLKKRR